MFALRDMEVQGLQVSTPSAEWGPLQFLSFQKRILLYALVETVLSSGSVGQGKDSR